MDTRLGRGGRGTWPRTRRTPSAPPRRACRSTCPSAVDEVKTYGAYALSPPLGRYRSQLRRRSSAALLPLQVPCDAAGARGDRADDRPQGVHLVVDDAAAQPGAGARGAARGDAAGSATCALDAQIVGTRYFEVLASGTTLLLCNRPKNPRRCRPGALRTARTVATFNARVGRPRRQGAALSGGTTTSACGSSAPRARASAAAHGARPRLALGRRHRRRRRAPRRRTVVPRAARNVAAAASATQEAPLAVSER